MKQLFEIDLHDYDESGFFRNCPSFASNGFISVIKYWYQLKAVNDNE